MKSAIVALTIVTNPVSAQDEEGTGESRVDLLSGVPYSTSLNCGECIASGFNFCWKTDIPGKILNDNYPKKNDDFKLTEQRCCATNAVDDKANCPDFKKMKDDVNSSIVIALIEIDLVIWSAAASLEWTLQKSICATLIAVGATP